MTCDSGYSKKAVKRAGIDLIKKDLLNNNPARYKVCMDILSKWRACHITVLNAVTRELFDISKEEDKESIVVSRLKRTPSVITKLKRNPTMDLDRMQDIAGCRSIVKSPKFVNRIRKRVKNKYPELKEKNYINKPKDDGYRGVHLVGKYHNGDNDKYYQVEIQVRTKIQHAWATSVEIVDLFTNQTLKSNIGKKKWKNFFRYAANEFAVLESTKYSDFMSSDIKLAKAISSLDIYSKFDAFRVSLKFIENEVSVKDHSYCLINIDIKKSIGNITLYKEDDFNLATKEYLKAEKRSAKNKDLVVALVSVASVDNLKEAFPNYFADSTLFIETLRKVRKPRAGLFARMMHRWILLTGLKE